MKKLSVASAFASFVFPLLASADFSGRWVGSGQAHDSTTWEANCAPMEIVIEQTPAEFNFVSHSFQCRAFNFNHSEPLPFAVQEGKLSLGDQPMGEISERAVNVHFENADLNTNTMHFTLTDPDRLEFAERVDLGRGYFLTVRGTFKRQP